jgi:hypothetical protein
MGFDPTGQYLLTMSHSGRGLFAVGTWERVARDAGIAYPRDGKAVGIGPIQGQLVEVLERDDRREQIAMISPDGRLHLLGNSEGITITEPDGPANGSQPARRVAMRTSPVAGSRR